MPIRRSPGALARAASTTATVGSSDDTAADEFRVARRCRCCGRFLTAGDSVRAGIGPVCGGRADG